MDNRGSAFKICAAKLHVQLGPVPSNRYDKGPDFNSAIPLYDIT